MSLDWAVLNVSCIALCVGLETGDAAGKSSTLAKSGDAEETVLDVPACTPSYPDSQGSDTKKDLPKPDCDQAVDLQPAVPSGPIELAMLGSSLANPLLTETGSLQPDLADTLQEDQVTAPPVTDPWSQHAIRSGLTPVSESNELSPAGRDIYQRRVMMSPGAKRAWLAMRAAARSDGIELQLISAFRSRSHQTGIVQRKLARGIPIEEVLSVNAAPGFSEHHSGNAIDIGAPGMPPAEESFESTPAFRWLSERAAEFGFTMSYPRGNPYGIVYEPWHWYWREAEK